MLSIALQSILICAAVGLIVKWILDKELVNAWRGALISKREYAITLTIISLIIVPLSTYIGWKTAQSNKMSFVEYVNGWETAAKMERVVCMRDGPCRWSYSCDPYDVCVTSCDDDGCSTSCTTHYHDCPYCTEEWNYRVGTTVGEFDIAIGRFPLDPDSKRWRNSVQIPLSVQQAAGIGIPERWADVRARLDSQRPGPVTKQQDYINYVLASNTTILAKFDEDVDYYGKLKVLPPPPEEIYDFYHARKAIFVGGTLRAGQKANWNLELEYLNAMLGMTRQGDAYVVVVNDPIIHENPDRYAIALEAYWKSWEAHKANAIGKNSLVLIVGTEDDAKVSWVRGFTGMPNGNETLVQTLQQLKNKPLTVLSVLGEVRRLAGQNSISGEGLGTLTMRSDGTSFKRTKMGDYMYLKGEIVPSASGKRWVLITTALLAVLCWIGPVMFDDGKRGKFSYGRYYRYA
jgi:hypothetical protein